MASNWHISRRHMLQGSGAVMALPFLEAMGAATAGQGAPPVRMAVLYMPNGVNPHHWTPTGEGEAFTMSEILAPLESHRGQLNVLSGLTNSRSHTGDGHYVKTAGFLTGQTITKTTGRDLNSGGVSMDQLAAAKLGNATRIPSLEMGIDPVATGVDRNVGYTQLYGSHISWRSPTSPVPCQLDPTQVFNRLFRPRPTTPAEYARSTSVIDLVREDAGRLNNQLGLADRQKLDEYLDAVREVERRLERERALQSALVIDDPEARKQLELLTARVDGFGRQHPDAQAFQVLRSGDHTEYVRLMLDILALALWTDSTRVSTFMFGRSVSGKNFSFLDGVNNQFHELSHHENKPEKLEQYKRINIWHTQQVAYFLDRMRSIKEGEGTLLDHSMILIGSSLRDGNKHEPVNLPLVLAGSGGGRFRTGRHLVYPDKTPLANLFVSMLEGVGTPVPNFADSTGPLANLV